MADTPPNLAKWDARRMEKIAPSLTALEMPHFTTGQPVREENVRERATRDARRRMQHFSGQFFESQNRNREIEGGGHVLGRDFPDHVKSYTLKKI